MIEPQQPQCEPIQDSLTCVRKYTVWCEDRKRQVFGINVISATIPNDDESKRPLSRKKGHTHADDDAHGEDRRQQVGHQDLPPNDAKEPGHHADAECDGHEIASDTCFW